jgi:N-methylhydantoinase A/oxoprolinase/acetone carboxylase beta subunit
MNGSLRLGIDVGGTNTDAVVVDGLGAVLATVKVPTTPEPLDGIRSAIEGVVTKVDRSLITQAMLGTTHPANAIIQRRGLDRVGILRLAAPGSYSVKPGSAWPADLRAAIMGPTMIAHGGFEYDGREIAPLDPDEIKRFAAECAGNVKAIAISCAFSPANFDHEFKAEEILRAELGDSVAISLSHQIGSLGLLEREDATALNAALLSVSNAVVSGLDKALADNGLSVTAYLTQNDGTLMGAEQAVKFPILTVGSGPTNSMRGACALAGLQDALVIDVGGTSSDVGILVNGFPRESATAVEVGGVRTNFRMPDLISIGLGGGTIVRGEGADVKVGPDSVGYRVVTEALVMGGSVPTLSDVSVKGGRLSGFGDAGRLGGMSEATAAAALAWVDERIQTLCDRMKASRQALPLIAVGGGSHLVAKVVPGVSEVITPNHFAVANAFGAAIAEASGEVDRVYRYEVMKREDCLEDARRLATEAAVRAGADPATVRITSLSEVPMTYVPGSGCRVLVKAAGPLATAG